MGTRIVVLGAGFGGLELATLLSEALGDDVDVTLIDKNDAFVFGYSKLDVMFGRTTLDAVRLAYRDIAKPGVRFLQQTIELNVLDLVAPSAFLAQEQRAMMGVTEVLAGRIGVAALDLVEKTVLEKKIESAINGRRRDRLALATRQLVDDRIGPEGG